MFRAIDDEYENQNNKAALLRQLAGPSPAQAPAQGAPASGVGGAMSNAASALGGLRQQQPAAPTLPEAAPMAAPPAKQGVGQYANKLEGFGGMLQDGRSKLEHGDSPKYQFARVMSNFDPKGGISQDMLDALNKLGLGSVSGKVGGDKISIGGQMDPRWNGVTEFDIIRDLENGGGWQWGDIAADQRAAQAAPGMGGGVPGMGGGLNSLLTGDATSAIQAALAQYSKPSSNLQALLDQLQGTR